MRETARRVIVENVRREHEAFRRQAGALRVARAKALGIANQKSYLLIKVPGHCRPVTRLPRRRLNAFHQHLAALIATAVVERAGDAVQRVEVRTSPEPAPVSAEMADVLAKGCAHCRGHCCGSGWDHAFLRVERVSRYMAAHPDLSPDDVLSAYLSYVGTRTVRNSCVFHGARGCTLPRDMRADICNEFYCNGLRELMNRAPGRGPVRAFYASTAGGRVKGSFVDVREVRVVRKRDRGSGSGDGGSNNGLNP